MNDSFSKQIQGLAGSINRAVGEELSSGPEHAQFSDQQPPRPRRDNQQPRKRMDKDAEDSRFGPTVTVGSTKIPLSGLSDEDRKKLTEGMIKQQQVGLASEWSGVIGRVAAAALSAMGAVVMGYALVQGIKQGSRGE